MKRTTLSSTRVSSGSIQALLVPRGGEQPIRRVLDGQHRMDAGNGQRRGLVDRDDPGVRMRRAQQLDVQQALDRDVEGVARRAAHHLRAGRRRQAAAEGGAGRARPRCSSCRRAHPRSRDSRCSGRYCPSARRRDPAAAPGSARRRSGSCPRCRSRTGTPARRETPAASGAGAAVGRKAFDGGDGVAIGAEGRDQAAMHRLAVDQHGAGAAVAGVAALLDAEMPEFAQEGSQALAGARGFAENSLPLI